MAQLTPNTSYQMQLTTNTTYNKYNLQQIQVTKLIENTIRLMLVFLNKEADRIHFAFIPRSRIS